MATPSPAYSAALAPSPPGIDCAGAGVACSESAHLLPEFWALGLASTSVSAVLSISGMLLQKVAHARLARAPEGPRARRLCGLPMTRLWWAGFVLLVICPLPFDFVALGLAPASLVFPFGASVTVLAGQVLAPRALHREVMRGRDWLATLAVVAGCCLTTAFGNHDELTFGANQILDLYTEPVFLLVLAALSVVFVASLALRHHPRAAAGAHPTLRLALAAYIPSYLGGVQMISFKSMSEVTARAALGGRNEWGTWPPWLFLASVVVLATVQLRYMNDGGARFQATKFFPAYTVCLTTIVVVFGAVFFKEYAALHPVAFPVGLVLIGTGIVLLAGDDPTDRGTAAPEDPQAALQPVPCQNEKVVLVDAEEGPQRARDPPAEASGDGQEPVAEPMDVRLVPQPDPFTGAP